MTRLTAILKRAPDALLMCALMLRAPGVLATSQETRHIEIAGRQREYILVTPDAMPATPRPVVLVLHGHLGSAANAMGGGAKASPLAAWLAIADRDHVWIAALQGLKGADNRTGWRDCRSDDTNNPHVDDVAFASAVVRGLIAAGQVDSKRVYVMGMSNGAMMSYRLALEMSPAPVAIAAVSGTMAVHSDCTATARRVSVLSIHGTDDPIVPYGGGEVGWRRSSVVLSAEATRDYWLRVDGLTQQTPVTYVLPHLGTDDTRATMTTYGMDSGPQVEFVSILHGGHVEPSRRYHYGAFYSRLVGEQNRDFESAEEAWQFFSGKQQL